MDLLDTLRFKVDDSVLEQRRLKVIELLQESRKKISRLPSGTGPDAYFRSVSDEREYGPLGHDTSASRPQLYLLATWDRTRSTIDIKTRIKEFLDKLPDYMEEFKEGEK
jgi:hypothetical protein